MPLDTPQDNCSKPFYVLRDKKYKSFIGAQHAPNYVSNIVNARRFATAAEAQTACLTDDVRACASLLTGGLELVKVTEIATPLQIQLLQGRASDVAMGTKWVVVSDSLFLRDQSNIFGNWVTDVKEATLYDTEKRAIAAITKRAIDLKTIYRDIELRRVVVTPGKVEYKQVVVVYP